MMIHRLVIRPTTIKKNVNNVANCLSQIVLRQSNRNSATKVARHITTGVKTMDEIIRLAKQNVRAHWMQSDGTYTMCELSNIVINQLTDELSTWAQNIDDSCHIHGGTQREKA